MVYDLTRVSVASLGGNGQMSVPGIGQPGLSGAGQAASGSYPGASLGSSGGPRGGVGGGLSSTGTADLVGTLTMLQHGNVSGLQNQVGLSIDATQIAAGNVNVLRSLRETGAFGEVNQTDGLTFDIVSILFDYILDDPTIPDAMKALIGRLQIPMLKVALLDKALFSKKSHPARTLLDAVAAAAVGWNERETDDGGLYKLMVHIIRRIVDEFQDDVELFETALAELQDYLAKVDNDAEQRVEESTRSLRTREKIVLAKMDVDEALKERVENGGIRAFIRQFIFDYWRQLLIITHVEHGTMSEIWRDQLRTVDDLVWSIQEKATPQDRKVLSERLPQLLKGIKQGMLALDMDRTVCSKFLSMMASVHVVSVKNNQEASLAEKHLLGDSTEQDEPLSDAAEPNDEFIQQGLARLFERDGVESEELDFDLSVLDAEPAPEENAQELSAELMPFVKQVTEFDLGDWVEFDNEDGSTIRSRFTWISPATGRYLFTTRQGKKALDTTLTGLADQFSKGVARKVDTQPDPIFDRAIGNLMDKLEAQPSAAGQPLASDNFVR